MIHSGQIHMTSALKMYGVDLLKFRFGFSSVFKKNSDSVQNEFGLVRFEKMRFGLDIILIYNGSNDSDITDVTHNNDNKQVM